MKQSVQKSVRPKNQDICPSKNPSVIKRGDPLGARGGFKGGMNLLTDSMVFFSEGFPKGIQQYKTFKNAPNLLARPLPCRDEHEYTNIQIFKYFGARINIHIRFHYKVHIQIYSNIRSMLWIYLNNTECFEQTRCMSYGPKILREHSPPLVYHVSLVK